MNSKIPMMVIMMVIVLASAVFVVQGVSKQEKVASKKEAFHALQTDYIINNTKAERDNAPANSELSQQQAEIANYPSTLLELKLVGVGKILTGIAILLVGIMMALVMMPVRLGKIVNKR